MYQTRQFLLMYFVSQCYKKYILAVGAVRASGTTVIQQRIIKITRHCFSNTGMTGWKPVP